MSVQMSERVQEAAQRAADTAHLFNDTVKTSALNNDAGWQQAVAEYNSGKPLTNPDYQPLLLTLNEYYREGQAAPGALHPETAQEAIRQWNQDGMPSALDKLMTNVVLPAAGLAIGGYVLPGLGADIWGGITGGAGAAGQAAGAAGAASEFLPEVLANGGGLAELASIPGAGSGLTSGILSGAAGAGQGLGLSTLGTALTPAQAAADSTMMADRIAQGANSAANIASGGTLLNQALTPNGLQWSTNGMTAAEAAAAAAAAASTTGGNSLLDFARRIIPIAAPIIGGAINAGAANDAAKISSDATAASLAEQKRQFDIGQQNQTPWMNAGKTALGGQLDLMGLPGGTNGSSANSLAELTNSPGYQFRLDQGRRALEASFGGHGGMQSGKAGVAMNEYGQNYASGEYGNRLQQLANLSGTGQASASGMAAGGMNYANNVGNLTMGNAGNQATSGINAAAATQSGILGAGNALSSYLNPAPKQPTFKMVNGQWQYA